MLNATMEAEVPNNSTPEDAQEDPAQQPQR
jgi:hypothetical protein